jgi:hypothetical protein
MLLTDLMIGKSMAGRVDMAAKRDLATPHEFRIPKAKRLRDKDLNDIVVKLLGGISQRAPLITLSALHPFAENCSVW